MREPSFNDDSEAIHPIAAFEAQIDSLSSLISTLAKSVGLHRKRNKITAELHRRKNDRLPLPSELDRAHIKETLEEVDSANDKISQKCSHDLQTAVLALRRIGASTLATNSMLAIFEKDVETLFQKLVMVWGLADKPDFEDRVSKLRNSIVEFNNRWLPYIMVSAGPPPAPATSPPNGSKPKQIPKLDGPFGVDGFRFAGKEVRFGKSSLQPRLMSALWDTPKKRAASPQLVEDVMIAVWGENHDTEDGAFRTLCTATRRKLEKACCPITIMKPNPGTIQLSAV